jgi:hypothetical protein
MFLQKEKEVIISLASDSIKTKFSGEDLKIDESKLPAILKEKRACFVTLTLDGELRGCIGHLLPTQELYLDIIENARAAAFDDPRFSPLTLAEFKKTMIEVSILDIPRNLPYKTVAELVSYLAANKPGVIIKQGGFTATFLPQVWEDLETPEEFLTQLCTKAGLESDEWKKGKLRIEIYNAEKKSV